MARATDPAVAMSGEARTRSGVNCPLGVAHSWHGPAGSTYSRARPGRSSWPLAARSPGSESGAGRPSSKWSQATTCSATLTGISRWIGVLEVVSEPFKDSAPIWKDEQFPLPSARPLGRDPDAGDGRPGVRAPRRAPCLSRPQEPQPVDRPIPRLPSPLEAGRRPLGLEAGQHDQAAVLGHPGGRAEPADGTRGRALGRTGRARRVAVLRRSPDPGSPERTPRPPSMELLLCGSAAIPRTTKRAVAFGGQAG
jgi:hypothetical protein